MATGSDDYPDDVHENEDEQEPGGDDMPSGHAQSAARDLPSSKKRQGGRKGGHLRPVAAAEKRQTQGLESLVYPQLLTSQSLSLCRTLPTSEEAVGAEANASLQTKSQSRDLLDMTLQELNNATQLIGKMLSAISQMNGNPAVADGMLPATSRVDMTKVVNRPSTFDGSTHWQIP
jgi:hypothetical protein